MQHLFLHAGKRKQMVHQAVHGGHHHAARILHQMAQHLQALPCDQVSVNIRTVKQQVLRRIQPRILRKAAEILINFLRPGIVIGHNQLPRTLRHGLVHQVYLLGIQTAADLHRSLLLFQTLLKLFKLRQLCKWICKSSAHDTYSAFFLAL